MRAMVLEEKNGPLLLQDLPIPTAGPGELLLKVKACGICRTDLHVVDGELTEPVLPLVPGHQIVAIVENTGAGVSGFKPGQRVRVTKLGSSNFDKEGAQWSGWRLITKFVVQGSGPQALPA